MSEGGETAETKRGSGGPTSDEPSLLRRILLYVMLCLAVLLALVSVAPLLESNQWWIRVWDYPRTQLAAIGGVVLILLALLIPGRNRMLWAVWCSLLCAVAFQLWRIYPYTPLADVETALARSPRADQCASVLIANVYMENRNSDTLSRLIRERQPSVVLLLETDRWWSKQLDDIKAGYRHVVDQPQDNTYGLLFMTNLAVVDSELRYLVKQSVPSIQADLKLRSGEAFRFYGLHPEPPRLSQDTDARDVELMLVAKEIRDHPGLVLVGGDLNDVAWSHTTRLFKRVSRTLDPRQGRGLYSSFNAEHALLRWPLDHLFHTQGFEIADLEVLPYTGSDHFPVTGRFCFKGSGEDNESQESMTSDDREDVEETLGNGQ